MGPSEPSERPLGKGGGPAQTQQAGSGLVRSMPPSALVGIAAAILRAGASWESGRAAPWGRLAPARPLNLTLSPSALTDGSTFLSAVAPEYLAALQLGLDGLGPRVQTKVPPEGVSLGEIRRGIPWAAKGTAGCPHRHPWALEARAACPPAASFHPGCWGSPTP